MVNFDTKKVEKMLFFLNISFGQNVVGCDNVNASSSQGENGCKTCDGCGFSLTC